MSVGDIEAGAGLAPRSGALYKYFDSKLAVLEAGLERHLASIADVEIDLSASPLTEPAAEIEAVVRWLLAELDRERTITHVIEREGDRLPELRDRMRTGVSDRGYRVASSLIERWTATITDQRIDNEALAVLLIGGLINLRRSTWSFGAPPLGLSDDLEFVFVRAARIREVAALGHDVAHLVPEPVALALQEICPLTS